MSLDEQKSKLRWGVEQRLEFIEFRLFWEGTINRADLISQFGVSVPQASKDLSLYQEKAPNNLVYDKSKKHYHASPEFQPVFMTPDADQYLSRLRSLGEHITKPDESWLEDVPSVDCMPIPHRRVNSEVLRTVLSAIRHRTALDILYQSMNPDHPDPIWRGISPHALGHDSFRWHIRAYCHMDKVFKDFLLSRCLDCRPDGEAQSCAEHDTQWQELIELTLIPNPKLSKSQQCVIAEDYEMKQGRSTLSIRKAFLYYFQKRLRLDVAEALDKPQEAPIVIENRSEFDAALAAASRKH